MNYRILLNEVFDKPNMDGVTYTTSARSIEYRFSDPKIEDSPDYTVFMRLLGNYYKPQQSDEDPVFGDHTFGYVLLDEAINRDKNVLDYVISNYAPLAIIFFEANDNPSLTNLKNEFFVYNKLVSTIAHFVETMKPLGFKFSGASQYMDLVYDRLIKLSNKLDKQNPFVPISKYHYIRKDVFELLDKDFFNDGLKFREEDLVKIKKEKNMTRKMPHRDTM